MNAMEMKKLVGENENLPVFVESPCGTESYPVLSCCGATADDVFGAGRYEKCTQLNVTVRRGGSANLAISARDFYILAESAKRCPIRVIYGDESQNVTVKKIEIHDAGTDHAWIELQQ